MDGTVDFFRGWNDYVNGFGEKHREFWLGNKAYLNLVRSVSSVGKAVSKCTKGSVSILAQRPRLSGCLSAAQRSYVSLDTNT